MPLLDIEKEYRISSQLATYLVGLDTSVSTISTAIQFQDKENSDIIFLDPITLDVKTKRINIKMPASLNSKYINFSYIKSEYLEYIEACMLMILNSYLGKDLS